MKKIIAFVLCLAIIAGSAVSAFAAEDTISGKTLRLNKTEGTVTVKKSSGKTVKIKTDMQLKSGYTIKTAQKSYAYISLDGSKAIKMDANTEIQIIKSGKKLEVVINSGKILCDVTSKLKTDESLNIRTSTMVTGIHGTTFEGGVDGGVDYIKLLSGQTKTKTANGKTYTLMSGEMISIPSSQDTRKVSNETPAEIAAAAKKAAEANLAKILDDYINNRLQGNEEGSMSVMGKSSDEPVVSKIDQPLAQLSGFTMTYLAENKETMDRIQSDEQNTMAEGLKELTPKIAEQIQKADEILQEKLVPIQSETYADGTTNQQRQEVEEKSEVILNKTVDVKVTVEKTSETTKNQETIVTPPTKKEEQKTDPTPYVAPTYSVSLPKDVVGVIDPQSSDPTTIVAFRVVSGTALTGISAGGNAVIAMDIKLSALGDQGCNNAKISIELFDSRSPLSAINTALLSIEDVNDDVVDGYGYQTQYFALNGINSNVNVSMQVGITPYAKDLSLVPVLLADSHVSKVTVAHDGLMPDLTVASNQTLELYGNITLGNTTNNGAIVAIESHNLSNDYPDTLTIGAVFNNNGTLKISGSGFSIADSATLTNGSNGTINFDSDQTTIDATNYGTVVNNGTINLNPSYYLYNYGTIDDNKYLKLYAEQQFVPNAERQQYEGQYTGPYTVTLLDENGSAFNTDITVRHGGSVAYYGNLYLSDFPGRLWYDITDNTKAIYDLNSSVTSDLTLKLKDVYLVSLPEAVTSGNGITLSAFRIVSGTGLLSDGYVNHGGSVVIAMDVYSDSALDGFAFDPGVFVGGRFYFMPEMEYSQDTNKPANYKTSYFGINDIDEALFIDFHVTIGPDASDIAFATEFLSDVTNVTVNIKHSGTLPGLEIKDTQSVYIYQPVEFTGLVSNSGVFAPYSLVTGCVINNYDMLYVAENATFVNAKDTALNNFGTIIIDGATLKNYGTINDSGTIMILDCEADGLGFFYKMDDGQGGYEGSYNGPYTLTLTGPALTEEIKQSVWKNYNFFDDAVTSKGGAYFTKYRVTSYNWWLDKENNIEYEFGAITTDTTITIEQKPYMTVSLPQSVIKDYNQTLVAFRFVTGTAVTGTTKNAVMVESGGSIVFAVDQYVSDDAYNLQCYRFNVYDAREFAIGDNVNPLSPYNESIEDSQKPGNAYNTTYYTCAAITEDMDVALKVVVTNDAQTFAALPEIFNDSSDITVIVYGNAVLPSLTIKMGQYLNITGNVLIEGSVFNNGVIDIDCYFDGAAPGSITISSGGVLQNESNAEVNTYGKLLIEAGASIINSGELYVHDSGYLCNSGSVHMNSGSMTVLGTAVISGGSVLNIDRDAKVDISGTYVSGGDVETTLRTGHLTVASGGTINVNSNHMYILDGGLLTNLGTINYNQDNPVYVQTSIYTSSDVRFDNSINREHYVFDVEEKGYDLLVPLGAIIPFTTMDGIISPITVSAVCTAEALATVQPEMYYDILKGKWKLFVPFPENGQTVGKIEIIVKPDVSVEQN